MTTFGLVPEGFNPMRLEDVQKSVILALNARFSPIDTDAESVVGQFVGLVSKINADLWEQLDRVYVVQHPSEAFDVQLDYTAEFNGLRRLDAVPSSVIVGLNGTASTIVNQGTQLKSSLATGDLFELVADTTISNLGRLNLYIRVNEIEVATDYTITINGTDIYTIDSGATPTGETIIAALIAAIDADIAAVVAPIDMGGSDMKLEALNSTSFDTVVTTNLSWFSPSLCTSISDGAIPVLEDVINIIETPVGGLDEVNNFEVGVKGRGVETDSEFQIRRANSLQAVGAATLPAIVARMQDDVEELTAVKGFENRTDLVDGDGRPPHSIEIVIEGPETAEKDSEIAAQLWLTKGGGCATFGNHSDITLDDNGDLQLMFWSRSVKQYAWVIATITLYDEESFPTDGITQVENQILAYGDTFSIGLDIIPDRYKGYIYEVPGIETIDIQIAITATPGGSPVYQGTKIAIADAEIAVHELSRISVIQI